MPSGPVASHLESQVSMNTMRLHSQYSLIATQQFEEKLGLQYKFSLQYEDHDFNTALVNLTDI